LPPKNESLAERLNSRKEKQEDEKDDAGALHARIQAGSAPVSQAGQSIGTVAATLDVPAQSISNWVKAEQEGKLGGAGTKPVSAEQMELSRLRAEVARLKMERDILKKACAYFAKEST
jgi:transposase